jgi:hypothetical protein
MPTNIQLEAQVAELKNRVDGLTRAAAEARDQARSVTQPVGMHGDGAAIKAEHDAHEAWKRSRGYHAQALPQVTLEDQTDEYQRQVASALKAERDQKEALQARNRQNALRRAEAGTQEPDSFARAASSAARQREIEMERRMRVAPIVVDAS